MGKHRSQTVKFVQTASKVTAYLVLMQYFDVKCTMSIIQASNYPIKKHFSCSFYLIFCTVPREIKEILLFCKHTEMINENQINPNHTIDLNTAP